jgi:hypothetical protein
LFHRFDDFPQSIFDTKAVTSNPWLLYGSKKGLHKEAYKLAFIVDEHLNRIDLDTMMTENRIYNYQNEPIECKEWEYHLPLIMSTTEQHKKHYLIELRQCDYSEVKKSLVVLPPVEKDSDKVIPSNPSEALRDAKFLLPLLSQQRAIEYKTWYEVGCVLYNVGAGSSNGLETWIDFSKRSPQFSEASCISRWSKMKKTDSSIGTLHYYAKMDSPIEYHQFKHANSRKSLMHSIQKNGQLSSYACAEAVYHKYKNDFVYTGNGKDGWYQYANHKWSQIAEGIELRKMIPTLRDPITDEIKKIREQINKHFEKHQTNKKTNQQTSKTYQKNQKKYENKSTNTFFAR